MATIKKYIVSFPSLECEQRAFEVLTGTGSKFSYVGNRKMEITSNQKSALEMQGVPLTMHK